MSNDKPKRGLGRKLLIGALALFGACTALTFMAYLLDDSEPTAEVAERSAATIEIAEPADKSVTVADTAITPTPEPPTDTPTPPTAVPPTDTPIPPTTVPTEVPPTQTSAPTATIQATNLEIIAVNKELEYVDIRNATGADVMLTGWVLRSETGSHDCPLDGVGLFPAGYTLRVYAEVRAFSEGEFSCGFENEIWNNDESDPAVLLDPNGVEVSRR